MTETAPSRARIAFDFAVVTLIWGSTWLVIKDQISVVPPGWTVTWRFVLATVGMVILATVRRESLRLTRPAMLIALAVGFLQFCMNYQLVYRAEHYLTSGLVAVMFALLMVPNAIFSRLMLKTRATPRFMIGSAVAIAGITLLLVHEVRLGAFASSVLPGIFLALGAMIAASIGNVLQATEDARNAKAVPLMTWAIGFGMVFDAILAWAMYGPPTLDPRPQYLAGVAYLAIFGTVLTFPIYFNLIRHLGAGRAAYNGVAVPVVAMTLSTIFEGYRWGGLAIGGSVLAMAGLVIALSGRR